MLCSIYQVANHLHHESTANGEYTIHYTVANAKPEHNQPSESKVAAILSPQQP